jgi:TusE/DsrC/DsvC family sulfur relay protein
MMLNTHIEKRDFFSGNYPVFDEDGYLLNAEVWNERLAAQIAEEEGVGPLTENHWRVLSHIRDKFFRIGALPNMRQVCRETGLPKSEVHDLFGGCLSAWRIAGLPNPGEEARTYLS